MGVSNSKLDAILKAAASDLLKEDIELARKIDTSNTIVSVKALRRVRRKIKEYDKVSWWNTLPYACRRVIAVLLCICTVAFGMCMSLEPVRAEFAKIFINAYEKFTSVFYVSEEKSPQFIEEYKEPMLQMAGTEKQVLLQSDNCYIIQYHENGEQIMLYQQMIITDSSADIDNERCTIGDTKVSGYDAKLFEYEDGRINLTWHDNNYAYTISSKSKNVGIELVYRIAESVK